MLFQRTVSNICRSCNSKEEIISKLNKNNIPYTETTNKEVYTTQGELVGGLIVTIDLGKVDESFYGEDYYGYEIFEIDKPNKHFIYSKMES